MLRAVFGILIGAIALAPAPRAPAGEADVVAVEVRQTAPGVYRFDVTVAHADEGWEHYADLWEVLGPDGAIIAARTLHHPHVDEQPFTRSLSGVRPPEGVTEVTIRARDSEHGVGGAVMQVTLPR